MSGVPVPSRLGVGTRERGKVASEWRTAWPSRAESALTNKDHSLRAHGAVWQGLVTKQWHTDERLTTDETGMVTLRGFHGDYRVSVTGPEGLEAVETISLSADGATVLVKAAL